jgi:hypothetical protein
MAFATGFELVAA